MNNCILELSHWFKCIWLTFRVWLKFKGKGMSLYASNVTNHYSSLGSNFHCFSLWLCIGPRLEDQSMCRQYPITPRPDVLWFQVRILYFNITSPLHPWLVEYLKIHSTIYQLKSYMFKISETNSPWSEPSELSNFISPDIWRSAIRLLPNYACTRGLAMTNNFPAAICMWSYSGCSCPSGNSKSKFQTSLANTILISICARLQSATYPQLVLERKCGFKRGTGGECTVFRYNSIVRRQMGSRLFERRFLHNQIRSSVLGWISLDLRSSVNHATIPTLELILPTTRN